jgi:hypothetical protein
MKKEAKLLLDKSVDSLILSIEMFNRPSDRGRIHSVLILLDHAFEVMLKAAIMHRGGKIREWRAKQTIGFDAAVRKAMSDAFLSCSDFFNFIDSAPPSKNSDSWRCSRGFG